MERKSSNVGLMEQLLQRKMSKLSLEASASDSVVGISAGGEKNKFSGFGRTDSADSVCSALSYDGNSDRCRCDDCILGITDVIKTSNASPSSSNFIRKVGINIIIRFYCKNKQ